MKQKFKTIVLSLSLAILGGVFFTSCNEDSLDLKKEVNYQSVDDYATKLVENAIEINHDLLIRNQQIFELPDRFAKELDLLGQISNYGDLEQLVNTTQLDLDLSKVNVKIILLEEVSEALANNAFSKERLIKAVQKQSQHQQYQPETRVTIRSRMACLRAYDDAASSILEDEIACVTTSLATDLGASVAICAVNSLRQLYHANRDFQDCIESAEQ